MAAFRFLLFLLLLFPVKIFSQVHHEYVVDFNHQNVTCNRLNVFPVSLVDPCTGYDENNKRLFFQGKTSQNDWTLYTVNVLTGAYQSALLCSMPYFVSLLEYDNATDTLYGIYQNGSAQQNACSFCWIDPVTGTVHVKSVLSAISYPFLNESTYDEQNHLFICMATDTSNVRRMFVVDAQTGTVLSDFALGVNVMNLNFNNTTHRLYAIVRANSWTDVRLDTISVATGALYQLASLGTHAVISKKTGTIDEASGHFIYVGSTYPQHDSIYTVDLQTNTIIDRKAYPFDPTAQVAAAENIIGYNFDESLGTIFAIQWGIEVTDGVPVQGNLSFSMSPNPATAQTVIYSAAPSAESVVMLTNALGEIVLTQTSRNASAIEINTAALSPGIYFVSLWCDGEKRGTEKLMIGRH